MGILTSILTAPIAPVRGTIWVAEQIRRQAEAEYYDPAAIRRQLEEVAAQRERGELPDDIADELEEELVARLIEGRGRRDHDGSSYGYRT